MYTQEDLQEAAERLVVAGTPYLGKTLYEGEGHKVVVLPFLRGHKERGLAYLVQDVNPTKPAWSWEQKSASIYYLSNMETGESEDLKVYIDKVLPCQVERWEGARKEAEREEQAARERAEYERFNGFTDTMTPMQRRRVIKCLDKLYRYKEEEGLDIQGGIMSRAARMKMLYRAGCTAMTRKDAQGKTEYWVNVNPNRGYIITKTEYEYFKYLESIDIPF